MGCRRILSKPLAVVKLLIQTASVHCSMFSSIWSVLQSPTSASMIPDFSTYKTDFFSKLAGSFLLRAEESCPGSPLVDGKDRPQKVVVGGGSGFVGGEVCRQLRRAGYEVILISRVQRQYGVTWEEVEKDGLPEGTHGVVNLAGQNVLDSFSRWTPAFKELRRSSRVETTAMLARAINRTNIKPEVFVQMSGVGYYPNTFTGKMMNEDGEKGTDWLSDLAEEWEEAGAGAAGVRRVVIRPGVVLGRGGDDSANISSFLFGTRRQNGGRFPANAMGSCE